MAFRFLRAAGRAPQQVEQSGGWYADPFGTAARRWYEPRSGWSDRVEGEGQAPDETGVARMDEAAISEAGSARPVDADGKLLPLSRPVDRKYMADAQPVR
jgi:hypothetical protein